MAWIAGRCSEIDTKRAVPLTVSVEIHKIGPDYIDQIE
jgi:hypothetical protein